MRKNVPEYGEGACIVISGKYHFPPSLEGSRWHDKRLPHDAQDQGYNQGWKSDPHITFCYVSEGIAAEWNGADGPIQLWYDQPPEGSEDDDAIEPHWIFPKAWGHGHWSQLAVNEYHLPDYLLEGKFQQIFNVLRMWTKR